jgi:hypothetical protein
MSASKVPRELVYLKENKNINNLLPYYEEITDPIVASH